MLNAKKKADGGTYSELESIANLIATSPEEFNALNSFLSEICKGSTTMFKGFKACLLDWDLKRCDNEKSHNDTAFVSEIKNLKTEIRRKKTKERRSHWLHSTSKPSK